MGVLDLFSKDKRDERARRKERRTRDQQVRPVARPHEGAGGAADDGSDEALYGLLRRFGMMYDKTIEDEQEKDWVFEALVEKGAPVLPALKKLPARRRLDLLAAAAAGQGRRHQGGASTSSRRSSRATSPATSATRPRRFSSSTTSARSSTPGAAAGRPLPRGHGRGRALHRGRDAARAGNEAVAREPLLERSSRRRRRACACASGSPRASPSWAGWSADRRAEVEKKLPEASRSRRRAPTGASRRNPERRNKHTVPRRNDIKSVMLIGSGPIVIGQACEFDYSGTQGVKALQRRGLPGRAGQLEPGDDHDRSRSWPTGPTSSR